MLYKKKTISGFMKGWSFIPLALVLLYIFACTKDSENSAEQPPIPEFNESEVQVVDTISNRKEEIFFIVEEMPTFRGKDLNTFRSYIQRNVAYPTKAQEENAEGKVLVQFVVTRNGSVAQVQIIKKLHPLLDQEVLRAVKNSPQWEPGKQKGHKVNV